MFPHPTIIGMGRPVDVPMLMGRPIDVQMLMGRPIDVPMFMGRPINVPMFMGRPIDVSMFVLPLKCFMYPFDSWGSDTLHLYVEMNGCADGNYTVCVSEVMLRVSATQLLMLYCR